MTHMGFFCQLLPRRYHSYRRAIAHQATKFHPIRAE